MLPVERSPSAVRLPSAGLQVAGLREREALLNTSLARAWKELGKEASADVVERRRIAEADVRETAG